MNINFNVPQAGSQPSRTQPSVIGDRSPDAPSATAPAKRLEITRTTATFSSESLKLSEEGVSVGKPESVKNFLSNYDFRNISPKDLAEVSGVLFKAGVLEKWESGALIGTEQSYEKPLDINAPIDSFKIYDDSLAASISAGPNSGQEYHTQTAALIRRIADFATSDRDRI